MLPIDEILMFESNQKITEISNLVEDSSYLNVTIPVHGLQINEKVKVENTDSGQISARPNDIVHFCTGNESIPVILRIPKAVGVVVGKLIQIMLSENKVKLTDFRKLKQSWKERAVNRVQPRFPVYFDITLLEGTYRGYVIELSQSGMSICVAISNQNELNSVINQNILIPLKLQPFLDNCPVNAMIKNIRVVTQNMVRFGLQILQDQKDTGLLKQYVHFRSDEILKEFHTNFKRLQTIPETKDLYF